MKYGLIILVTLVWGAIVIRVVGGMSGTDVPVAIAHPRPKTGPPPVRDEFVLFADYPDPFIPEPDSLDELENKKTGPGIPGAGGVLAVSAMITAPKPMPPPEVQSFLQYTGMISNPEKKQKIAIVNLHGKELLVKEKEKHDGVLIRKIDKEKIGVVYKGKYVEVEKAN